MTLMPLPTATLIANLDQKERRTGQTSEISGVMARRRLAFLVASSLVVGCCGGDGGENETEISRHWRRRPTCVEA